MIRLSIVVEGETETVFVKQMLNQHLLAKGVDVTPVPLGGNVSVERLADRMTKLFWNFDRVTSLVDLYGFRRKGNLTSVELEQGILERIKARLGSDSDESRIIPYVQQYEFEGLLFSATSSFAILPDVTESAVRALSEIRATFDNPEEINDSSDTAPSKRIIQVITGYNKAANGPAVALEIGLDAIRQECPRFNRWVEQLESLG